MNQAPSAPQRQPLHLSIEPSRRSPVALDRATVAPPLNVTHAVGGEGEHTEGSLGPYIREFEPLMAAVLGGDRQVLAVAYVGSF